MDDNTYSDRLDELDTADDYNRFEEREVFQDQEREGFADEYPCDECGEIIPLTRDNGPDYHADWCSRYQEES